jgi:hypothetical protein
VSRQTMAEVLVEAASVWGIRLERRQGERLVISPASKCPLELKALLAEHKKEVLGLLEAEADGLTPDQAPWLYVARQVVLWGEFDNADASTVESLTTGLRGIPHPLCKQALERLAAMAKAQ